jgi:proteic killer suppression protein
MIRSFRHKGLKRLYEKGDARGVSAEMLAKVEVILADLDAAETPEDLGLPGYGLHALKGDLKGFWSVKVTGNWRIVFWMEDGDVYRVDLTDYH